MNTTEQSTSVASPALKVVTAWGAIGITSWSDAAAALAFIYTLCLLCEWFWKKCGRPFAEKHGWVKRKQRRFTDSIYKRHDS